MLRGTIRKDDFQHNRAMQHCGDIYSSWCNIVLTIAALKIVVANCLVKHHLKDQTR